MLLLIALPMIKQRYSWPINGKSFPQKSMKITTQLSSSPLMP